MTPRVDGLLPIREVARLTGVNAVTLRAWERRYGLIEPHRTEKGHRLYSPDNLDRVRAILTWLSRGVNVGQVKGLLEQECAQAEHPGDTPWGMLRNELLEGLRRFDMGRFEQHLQRYREHYCSTLICERVFEPLMELMQQRWQGQFGSQLEEVFFHTWLRDQIAAWMRSCSGASEAGRVVLVNLSTEHYAPAMWLLAALLADQGVAVRLLEWEFPASELTLLHDQSSLCAVVFYSSQAELWASRVSLTERLVAWIDQRNEKPATLISGSAVGWYGDGGELPLTEDSAARPAYTHTLCDAWEAAARRASAHGVRVCLVRTGLVLAPGEGFLKRMLLPFRLGLGGRLGSGQQYMSWVHLADEVGIILHLLRHADLKGVFNATAPNPVTNREFTSTLAATLHRPAIFPVPALVLKAGLGEMATLLLMGQNARPARLQEVGYRFQFSQLDQALKDVVGEH